MRYSVILWRINPLLRNDRELDYCTGAIDRQMPAKKGGNVFSVWSAPMPYRQDGCLVNSDNVTLYVCTGKYALTDAGLTSQVCKVCTIIQQSNGTARHRC
jgi:hypothetical protein